MYKTPMRFAKTCFMAPEGDGGGDGGSGGTGAGTGQQTGTPPGTGGQTSGQSNGGTGTGDRTFTQAEVNALVEDRLARERRQQEERDKKAKDDAEAVALVEQKKFEDLANQRGTKLSEAEQKLKDLEAQNRATVVRYEVALKAATLGFADPEDAHAFIDLSTITFDANGKPTNVEDLLKAVLEKKPYLKAQTSSNGAYVPATPRASGPQTHDQVVKQTTEEMKTRIRPL